MKCTAKAKRSGTQCNREAIAGGNVCRVHGGAAPQVKAKAKLRLLELVAPALAVLARSMKEKPMPNRKQFASDAEYEAAVAARQADRVPAAVALKAATEVLDRAGLDLENQAEMGRREMVVRFVKPEVKE